MGDASFSEEYLEEQSDDYAPLNKFAVGSLIFLLIGSVAPFMPAMLVFDILAITFSVVALLSMQRYAQTGRRIALFSLVVGFFFVGLVPTLTWQRRQAVTAQAIEHASKWVDLIRDGDFHAAHQLTFYYSDRKSPHITYEAHYRKPAIVRQDLENPDPYTSFLRYFMDPPKSWMKAEHDQLKYAEPKVIGMQRVDAATARFAVRFEIERPSGSTPIVVVMERNIETTAGMVHWQVFDVHVPPNSNQAVEEVTI